MVGFSVVLDYSQSLLLLTTLLYKHLIGKKVPGICGLEYGHTAVPSALRSFWSSLCHASLVALF